MFEGLTTPFYYKINKKIKGFEKMKIKQKYTWYCDSGHAWLKVTRSDLNKLGIENKISNYSFIKGDNVYLEEDCDATIFIKEFQKQYNIVLEAKNFTEKFSKSSSCRNYPRYKTQMNFEKEFTLKTQWSK